MGIYDDLKNDMIKAMKDKDKETLGVIRMVKSAVDLEHIDKKKDIDDSLTLDVLTKQVKTRKESLDCFSKAQREDLVKKIEKELQVLEKYLPKQLDINEINTEIEKAFSKVKPESIKDMSKVMKEVTPVLKGKADMKEVSNIIKEKLTNKN